MTTTTGPLSPCRGPRPTVKGGMREHVPPEHLAAQLREKRARVYPLNSKAWRHKKPRRNPLLAEKPQQVQSSMRAPTRARRNKRRQWHQKPPLPRWQSSVARALHPDTAAALGACMNAAPPAAHHGEWQAAGGRQIIEHRTPEGAGPRHRRLHHSGLHLQDADLLTQLELGVCETEACSCAESGEKLLRCRNRRVRKMNGDGSSQRLSSQGGGRKAIIQQPRTHCNLCVQAVEGCANIPQPVQHIEQRFSAATPGSNCFWEYKNGD